MKLLLNALLLTGIMSCNGKAEKTKEEPKAEVATQKKSGDLQRF